MAAMHARSELRIGAELRHESVIAAVFAGCLVDTVQLGGVTRLLSWSGSPDHRSSG
jgi:proline racemase